ncbi:hypothetical protein V1511DRAFT_505343 [Dipodascopsis uninucleata]
MDGYDRLGAFLESRNSGADLNSQTLDQYYNNIRANTTPRSGALAAIWPGILHVLRLPALSSYSIESLIDEVITPLVKSNIIEWPEVRECVGSWQVLIESVKADTHDKIRQAALDFLSLYDFSEGDEFVEPLTDVLFSENLSEQCVARIEKAFHKFLTGDISIRQSLIGALSAKVDDPTLTAVALSRLQSLVLILLKDTGSKGVPDNLLKFAYSKDDTLSSLTTMKFYEKLLSLNLPPSVFETTYDCYENLVNILFSHSTSMEKTEAAVVLGQLARSKPEVFERIDNQLGVVRNLTLRDETDCVLLRLISGDYIAAKAPQLIVNFPVSSSETAEVLSNLCLYRSSLKLLRLETASLAKLPVESLLLVCLSLASTKFGARTLVSLPGIMDMVIQRRDRMGYDLARIRGDVIDALAEQGEDVLGPWARVISEEKRLGPWASETSNEARVDVLDRTAG